MYSHTLISTLVLIALLCSTIVVSDDMSESEKLELANKLNTLVRHRGWRLMYNVQINKGKNNVRQIADPISEILEAISLNRDPVDESNVLARYKEIWTMLMCKYAMIVLECKINITNLIRACRGGKKTGSGRSFQGYYNCFQSVLTKLYMMSSRFTYMTDALDFLYTLGPHPRGKHGVVIATQKLSEYTLNLRQRTLTKLSQRDIDVNAVDHELQIITDYINMLIRTNIHWYTNRNCNISAYRELTPWGSNEEFMHKKINRLIPQEMTMVQYVENEIDAYVDGFWVNWFENLGFAYDVAGNIKIT